MPGIVARDGADAAGSIGTSRQPMTFWPWWSAPRGSPRAAGAARGSRKKAHRDAVVAGARGRRRGRPSRSTSGLPPRCRRRGAARPRRRRPARGRRAGRRGWRPTPPSWITPPPGPDERKRSGRPSRSASQSSTSVSTSVQAGPVDHSIPWTPRPAATRSAITAGPEVLPLKYGEEAGRLPVGGAGDHDPVEVGEDRRPSPRAARAARGQRGPHLTRLDLGLHGQVADPFHVPRHPLDRLVRVPPELVGGHAVRGGLTGCAG